MKKFLSYILAAAFMSVNFCNIASANDFGVIEIPVRTNSNISSSTLNAGDSVSFTVMKDIINNGNVVIYEGTPVIAKVKSAKSRARVGKPGQFVIEDFSTTLVNGNKIPLYGEVKKKAESQTGLSVFLSVAVIPFFLLMKGKDVQLDAGYQTTLYTTADIVK
ncbi:hypothetical protein II906_05350 [bacterium]|nr:hypothetical protein [bacterium]